MARRIHTFLALLVVFLMVLATNRIDQHHFEKAQETVNEVFKDRVLVQGYIFSIAQALHEKELMLAQQTYNRSKTTNAAIEDLIADFETTKLTRSEAELLSQFKSDFVALQKLETRSVQPEMVAQQQRQITNLKEYLNKLSEIQITESRNLTTSAQKSLDMSNMIANFEIFFLICIGIALQIIVFYKAKKSVKA